MLDTLDVADRVAVQQWIALSDAMVQRVHDPRAYQTRGCTLVASAINALLAYEHQLPAYLRLVAHETLWQREHPALPLPAGRDGWSCCQCRTCQVMRLHERRDDRRAVYAVQLAAVRRQRSS